MMEAEKAVYESPVVLCPSLEELSSLNEELRFKLSREELTDVQDHFKGIAQSLQRLSHLEQPALPVKYPRTSGYKPRKEDNPYNAWCWRCNIKGAVTGKLTGKTIGIKDSIAVAGVPMMNGSKLLQGYTPEFDATVVTRILDAGGHILGKTNCEHLSMSGASFNCDNGPVNNPHDETRSTGGSSSGSAALVASGHVDMALGGDQGGSVRIPASWCGIVGLKPTYGLVPYTGASHGEPTMDHLGPMTRNVEDCALMLEVIAGFDEGRDPRQLPNYVPPEYTKLVNNGVSGKKIGVVKEGFELCKESDVAELVRREVDKLTAAGATVEEISVPEHKDGLLIRTSVSIQGKYNFMMKGNGNGYFWKGHYCESLQEAFRRGYETRPYDLAPTIKSDCLFAEYLNRNYSNKFYAQGQNLTWMLTKAYNRALDTYDVLVMPTMLLKATKHPKFGASLKEQLEACSNIVTNTCPFNITGHPAITTNAGFSEGLPVGMMIIGRHYDDTTVLQVARAYEKIRDGK